MLWVLDLDGVVWLAGDPIPGSADAVQRLRDAGEAVAFVTNNSGPSLAQYVERLAHAGVAVQPDELVTSAQAAVSLLAAGTRTSFIGGEGLAEALEHRGVEVVPPSDAPEAVVIGRSLQLDFDQLAAVSTAIRNGARFVATNTDATYPTPHGLEPGAGALIAFVQTASGAVATPAGKPGQAMADLVRNRFGPPGVVVGDQPATDGLFAERVGAPFALVLSGVTKSSDLPVSPAPAIVGADLAAVVADKLG